MVYRLNNYGFRDDDFEIARNHRIRIAAIGDSYCWGTGVKEQHRFTALLEAGLEQASVLGQHYEIYNFCLPGFNTQSEVALYEQVVWHFRPDLLLVSFVLNDVNLRNDRFVGPPESEPGRLRKWRERFRIADWVAARIDARRVRNAYVADVAAAYRRGHPGFESVVAALERLARRNRPSGIPTLLVIFPWIADLAPGRYPFHAAHRAVREAGEARGFEVVELFGFFAGRDAEELWIHRVDQHPNQVAHRIAADAIQPRLGEVLTRSGEELLARAEQRRIRPLPRELGAAPTRRWYEAFAAANSDR
jgi:hypothetical protein